MISFVNEIVYAILLLLGLLGTFASLYSVLLGRRYNRKVVEAMGGRKVGFQPNVCLIMPCKGDEHNLARNIETILKLDYPNYQVIIVTDSKDDPAYRLASTILRMSKGPKAELLISTQYANASGKVSAMLTALERSKRSGEVYAFIDSDSTINTSWLTELVDPLGDPSVGATTGFRWYLGAGFWPQVQSAWNASGSNLMFDDNYNFPWGGAMALRAETLDRICIKEVWKNAVSDDLTLNIALRKYGYHTLFIPQCTVVTFTDTGCSTFLKWATNQTALIRAYHRKLWNYALVAYTFFDITFIAGLVTLILGLFNTTFWFLPATLLLTSIPIGVIRSQSRILAFQRVLPWVNGLNKKGPRAILASLIVPWIMAYCIVKSISIREIEWRGRNYNLRKAQIAPS